ncbi:hypothetical protein FPZ42_14400 [Mucilaginibacter achroorhodeus]|uniref:MetA-pathway of phenol degradation n=1 Tax=Mucilaginibacter achroorhodeus TaxID=2599294 RepID=A0A563U084_9SPHI|nr:hypothetical protein [Mucilaginibacter achroorhodeus]TWR24943.1 hypothetical protein FPZ42_14400 [Mucilaginibacter achroorhodeus]
MKKIFFLLILACHCFPLLAQDNYEIQVYGSETVEKGRTMVELHSNNTLKGSKTINEYGMLPTNHVEHETIEITHGWTPWFETGFYFFNSVGNDGRSAYVGSHIRPRVAAPTDWKWPVGVSLSLEFGFQRSAFDPNTETLEIRPIVDKKLDKVYLSFNPTMEKSFRGPDRNAGLIFSPNLKGSYDLTKVIALGLEYYGSTGPLFHFNRLGQQDHQIFIASDLDFSANWEVNFGYGIGSQQADRSIIKLILGRRF